MRGFSLASLSQVRDADHHRRLGRTGSQLSVSLQAVTFGLSFCHRQFRGVVHSRALRSEHLLTTFLGRRLSVPRFRPRQLAQPCI